MTTAVSINVGVPTISWANPADISYGTTLGDTQLDATASVAGTFSYTLADGVTDASGALLSPGADQVILATFTPTDTTDYAPVTASVTINVGVPTITWANPDDISYGTALDSTQLDATASVAGSFSYTLADGVTDASGAL